MDCPISDVDGIVIGGHSDKGMLPLTRLATRNSVRAFRVCFRRKIKSSFRRY